MMADESSRKECMPRKKAEEELHTVLLTGGPSTVERDALRKTFIDDRHNPCGEPWPQD